MKKVRITLKKGKDPWSFTLYDSAESALYLRDDPQYDDNFEEEYKTNLTLREGDILEVEWLGSEWVYPDDPDRLIEPDRLNDKYENIRLGKFSDRKGIDKKSGYVEVYSGWIVGGTIPWNPSKGGTLKIKNINDPLESLIDFSEIFRDDLGVEEEENRFDPKITN